jgi:hypothetical protein
MEIIDLKKSNYFSEIEISERELSDIIFRKWTSIFPNLELIQKEFTLTGEVRDFFTGGRIDFFAYNREKRSFTLIEIKKVYDKNIRNQIFDYVDAVEDNFELIFLRAKQTIPDIKISDKSLELILFAKFFKTNDYERIKKIEYPTKLITYRYFEKNYILLDRVDNSKQIKVPDKKMTVIEKPIQILSEDEKEINNFWRAFFDMCNRQVIIQNDDYRIEGNELMLQLSSTHKKYITDQMNRGYHFVSLSYLRKHFRNSKAFLRHIKSVKFKTTNTSAYVFDYEIIRNDLER